MQLEVNGHNTFCYTGGKAFDPAKPTVVFIHGVLNDHSVWILQTRYLANHGWNVLAPDLPGHGRSGGEPPATVEQGADFVLALVEVLKIKRLALVGHSFGSLIVLEAAARAARAAGTADGAPGDKISGDPSPPQPVRAPDAPAGEKAPPRQAGVTVSHLVLAGTAAPMKVSQTLLDASLNEPLKGIDMVNVFQHSMLAPPPSTLGPGTWLYGSSRALMRRVLASNVRTNVFHTGFRACDSYSKGEAAMKEVEAPTLFILGTRDQMTPPKAAQPLVRNARHGKTVLLPAGHQMMSEAPDGVLMALRDFLAEA
ncbi:MAG: alpha/beta hydrolase [Burkholderiaceae bacterium]